MTMISRRLPEAAGSVRVLATPLVIASTRVLMAIAGLVDAATDAISPAFRPLIWFSRMAETFELDVEFGSRQLP